MHKITHTDIYIYIYIYHQSILCKGRSFTANSGTKTAVLPKGRYSTSNSRTKIAVLLGMNRCSSFPLLSATYSLFSILTDLKRSEKIPGAPTWRRGEWIWLTRPSGLQRNSSYGVKYQFHQGFWPDQRSGNHILKIQDIYDIPYTDFKAHLKKNSINWLRVKNIITGVFMEKILYLFFRKISKNNAITIWNDCCLSSGLVQYLLWAARQAT